MQHLWAASLLIARFADGYVSEGDAGVEFATAKVAGDAHIDLVSELAFVLFLGNDLVLDLKVYVVLVDKAAGLETSANVATVASIYHAYIGHEKTQVCLVLRHILFIFYRKYW